MNVGHRTIPFRPSDPGSLLLGLLAAGFALAAGLFGWQAWDGRRTRAEVLALAAGQDRPVPESARPDLLLARAAFLLDRGRVEEAEALIEPMQQRQQPRSLAMLLYNLGNGRLRTAFAAMEAQKVDDAAANIRVAKDHYRRALAVMPDDYDAKFNLDLAMRLVRDFPRQQGEPDEDAKPMSVWTDLPGRPRGLP